MLWEWLFVALLGGVLKQVLVRITGLIVFAIWGLCRCSLFIFFFFGGGGGWGGGLGFKHRKYCILAGDLLFGGPPYKRHPVLDSQPPPPVFIAGEMGGLLLSGKRG